MAWAVEYTDQFETWWDSISEDEQVEISAKVELLQKFGPVLPRPHADVITTSRHANMKELRGKVKARRLRVLYASTPGERRYCCSAAIKPTIRTGTRSSCRLPMTCWTVI
jgi:hypothetical protein